MLIIEGPDLVGKSTFVQTLFKTDALQGQGYMPRHLTRPSRGFDKLWGYVDLACQKTIQDRFHMSEPVYACHRRDSTDLDPFTYSVVDGYLRLLGSFTVIITADIGLITERYEQHSNREMYSFEMIRGVNSSFQLIANGDLWRGYSMDWDYHIHCTKEKPWPSEEDLSKVLNRYLLRQSSLWVHQQRRLESLSPWR